MPAPKEWPTLDTIAREHDACPWADPVAWAVRVRPQLEALVEKWRTTPMALLHAWDARQACIEDLAALLTPHEEHEETQG